MFKLRSGTSVLRIETGRYTYYGGRRQIRLEADQRECLMCMSGQVEDERHFLLQCASFTDEREECLQKVQRKVGQKRKRLQRLLDKGIK
eukprot:TRINITY_DN150_c0_g1_i8.p1 TRINITY_DN150_c0_g1~~TRINITY_DN150_c0_g1_i8.p1  ORF type:complete len:104 (+),score=16.62 TRINITY_DN150_c0_g1_i8:46-312(+)